METQQGLETVPKVEETPKPPEPVVKPPTAEEQMVTLQAQMVELKTKYEQADKGLRSAQATLTQKDRLLKDQSDMRGEFNILKNMVKVLAVRGQVSDEEADDLENTAKQKRPDINQKFEELEQKAKVREYQKQLQETINIYKERVETLGLKEDDERYWEIYKLVTNATPADFKLADIRLKKIEAEKEKPVDNKPTDDVTKKLETALKEIERLKMQVSGKLDSETGLPSGSSANETQIRKNFRENPRSQEARNAYMELQRNKKK